MSKTSAIQILLLPFPFLHSLPPSVEKVQDLGQLGNFPVVAVLSKLQDPIIRWFKSHPSPPVAIISDFFLGWTLQIYSHLVSTTPPSSSPWLTQTAELAAATEDDPIELPMSMPSIFSTTDEPTAIQIATSVLLTVASPSSSFDLPGVGKMCQRIGTLQFNYLTLYQRSEKQKQNKKEFTNREER